MDTMARGSAAIVDPYRTAQETADIIPDDRELGPRFAAIRMHVRCSACAQPVPVNGPLLRVQCPWCRTQLSIAQEAYTTIADELEEDHHRLAAQSMTLHVSSHGIECVLRGVSGPSGSSVERQPIPAWLVKRSPTAHALWLERSPRPDPGETITFACPACAVALRVSAASPRVLPCAGCDERVFVPDELWRELHGPAVMETWIVEFRGENRFDRARRLDREREARRAAKKEAVRDAEQRAEAHARDLQARDVRRLQARARIWTIAHLLVVAGAVAAPWVARLWPAAADSRVAINLATFPLILIMGVLGLAASARVITRATGQRDLMFAVWFNYVFVMVMPLIGHLLGLESMWSLSRGEYRRKLGPTTREAAINWAIVTFGGFGLFASLMTAYLC